MKENFNISKYRKGVGVVLIFNKSPILFHQMDYGEWQFPQGGIEKRETPTEAMYKELLEKTGVEKNKVISQIKEFISYKIPFSMRNKQLKVNQLIGQAPKWFLAEITSKDDISFDKATDNVFNDFMLSDSEYCIDSVIDFKKEMYKTVLKNFSHYRK